MAKNKALRSMNPHETDILLSYQYGRESAYEEETAITRTLDVLCAESDLVCHDQRMFQILHLNTELAWYNIHFELRRVIKLLSEANFVEAHHLCERASLLMKMPLSALETLISSMSQISLLEFRSQLPANATGVDSPGMINLRRITRLLWTAFEDSLKPLNHTPISLALIRLREKQLPVELVWPAQIFDAIQQFDIKLMGWKQLHLRLVWTHLGGAVASMQNSDQSNFEVHGCPLSSGNAPMPTSLRGKPISVLQKATVTPLFPKLWEIPDLIYQEMTKDNNAAY